MNFIARLIEQKGVQLKVWAVSTLTAPTASKGAQPGAPTLIYGNNASDKGYVSFATPDSKAAQTPKPLDGVQQRIVDGTITVPYAPFQAIDWSNIKEWWVVYDGQKLDPVGQLVDVEARKQAFKFGFVIRERKQ